MHRALALLACLVISSLDASAQDAEALVSSEEIPRNGYRSWSLFLVCNPNWVDPAKNADLASLYQRFQSFGDAIGPDNLAVWFWKPGVPMESARVASGVDVARSATYCRALSLRPSKGPYLVVTTEYPELEDFPKNRGTYTLGGVEAADLAELLSRLTDGLLLEGEFVPAASADAATTTSTSAPPSLWLRLLVATQQAFIGVGCSIDMEIDAGVLNAKLRACEE
jgi:hypothetical protein